MPSVKVVALAALATLAACSMTQDADAQDRAAGRMAWPDLLERPRPAPDQTIRYGEAAEQVVDLWLPAGEGPHPVALMVHGGCWQTDIADRTIMNWIAADLRGRGIAVWNIDYRGVDRGGGGYPGTFQDVARAADALREHGARHRLDLSRVVAVGHSAGGHLALWLAARARLPDGSPLRTDDPLPVRGVVSLGGLPDLEESARPPGSGCGTEIVGRLAGGRFDDTSVPRLAPLGVPQALVNGDHDRIIPTFYAEGYASQMRARGDTVNVRIVPGAGHVELVAPETPAWAAAVEEMRRLGGWR